MLLKALLIVAALGAILTSIQTLLVKRFLRGQRPFAPGPRSASPRAASTTTLPFVSILKPLSGLDDELSENLESFVSLEGVDYEVILSVADDGEPAAAVARDVMARFPAAPFRLVVGGVTAKNPKVERLLAAARVAAGDILFVSDSNVRVRPLDVARTVAAFDDPSVGCVSNVFVGTGGKTFGAAIEGLHLLTFVAPGTVLAASGGVPCVVGKSLAISRLALDAIGGFAAVADVLAEDQAIGVAVKRAGFRLALSPVVVRNVIVRRTLARALDRQIRWGKIRYAFSKATYTGELLLTPFGMALLALLVAALSASSVAGVGLFAAGVALLRITQAAYLSALLTDDHTLECALLMPVKDVLQLMTQLIPYVSRDVTWNGHRARLGPGTRLLPPRRGLSTAV